METHGGSHQIEPTVAGRAARSARAVSRVPGDRKHCPNFIGACDRLGLSIRLAGLRPATRPAYGNRVSRR